MELVVTPDLLVPGDMVNHDTVNPNDTVIGTVQFENGWWKIVWYHSHPTYSSPSTSYRIYRDQAQQQKAAGRQKV